MEHLIKQIAVIILRSIVFVPGLQIFGTILVGGSVFYHHSITYVEAGYILFYWYLLLSMTVGLYNTWIQLRVVLHYMRDEELSKPRSRRGPTAEEEAVALHQDHLDQIMFRSAGIRLLQVASIFVSLPLGAYLLLEAARDGSLLKAVGGATLITYGIAMHYRVYR